MATTHQNRDMVPLNSLAASVGHQGDTCSRRKFVVANRLDPSGMPDTRDTGTRHHRHMSRYIDSIRATPPTVAMDRVAPLLDSSLNPHMDDVLHGLYTVLEKEPVW